MITMAQGAFRKYKKEIQPNSILFMDKDLVKPTALPKGVKVYAVPATRMAEQLGRAVVANIVMLGFFVALTPYISLEAAEKALNMSVPKGTEEFNLKAFKNGYDYGKRIKKEGE
ncbi:MAG: Pyruvate ferredoxin/flavodoxin oxidoreductase [Candidatus Methanoperedenaceae archaeon GB37]|nr:MAG: Pyruvate ferredoxin/flavodoxin oxidoreductase [Candidatus Methanoperedenaceae archaeon GB37]